MRTPQNVNPNETNQTIAILLFSFILLAGCEKTELQQSAIPVSADNELRSSDPPPPPYTMLVIEHNCMASSLPDYNVYLRSDGSVTYQGWKNVAHTGIVKFQTDAETVSYIKNLFESGNFFNIQGIPSQFDDPYVSTTYSNRFATKTLIDYDQGKPQLLIQIRKRAEEKLNIARYVKFDQLVNPVAAH